MFTMNSGSYLAPLKNQHVRAINLIRGMGEILVPINGAGQVPYLMGATL